MAVNQANEPWTTDVPEGTTDEVILALIEAQLIPDLGQRTARQRWRKPLTFGFAHGIRTGAIPPEVVRILFEEARRILRGGQHTDPAELRRIVRAAFNGSADGESDEAGPRAPKQEDSPGSSEGSNSATPGESEADDER